MFNNYPKIRKELPDAYSEIYVNQYKENREGESTASGMAQKMESWLHKKIASDVGIGTEKKTLEIGAGTLNQLDYEKTRHYDIIEPFSELFKDSPKLGRINKVYKDISEIALTQKYDRITSIATLSILPIYLCCCSFVYTFKCEWNVTNFYPQRRGIFVEVGLENDHRA